MLFHAFCYIAATLFILWLRSESKPQQRDFSHAVKEALKEQIEQAEAENEEIEQPQPEQSKTEAIAEDIWDSEVSTSSPRFWIREPKSIKPTLALMPAKEEIKVTPTRKATTKKSQPLEVDLNSLDSAALRKLCSKHGIQWRDARGKGRHLTKAAMVFQLGQKAIA